jgi:hypothetical protein
MQGITRKLAILGLGLAPMLAFAGGVKPGLWEVEMEGMEMPGIPPEQMDQMKKMGVDVSKLIAAQKPKFCLTAEQAKFDKPPPTDKNNKDCKVDSWDVSGKKMKGKMTCDGDFKGTMDMTADVKSDTEYKSEVKMEGTARGQPANMTMKSTSRWLSDDCGSVKPHKS